MRKHNRKNIPRDIRTAQTCRLAGSICTDFTPFMLFAFSPNIVHTHFPVRFVPTVVFLSMFSPTRRNLYSNSRLSLCMFYYIPFFELNSQHTPRHRRSFFSPKHGKCAFDGAVSVSESFSMLFFLLTNTEPR